MTEYKKGDVVRVVMEGEVVAPDGQGFTIRQRPGAGFNYVVPTDEHVKSIERLAKPFKVGDLVIVVDHDDEIPVGTIARTPTTAYWKTEEGWVSGRTGRSYATDSMGAPREIVYLP